MAKSCRANRSRKNRRAERKSRRAERKSRRSERKGLYGGGLFGKLYSPVHQVLGMGENAVSAVANTVGTVAKTGLRGVNRIGRSVTTRTNAAVSGLLSRRRRAGRR